MLYIYIPILLQLLCLCIVTKDAQLLCGTNLNEYKCAYLELSIIFGKYTNSCMDFAYHW